MNINKKKYIIRGLSLAAIAIFIAIIIVVQNDARQENKYTSTFYDVFDTVTTITGYATDEATFLDQVGEVKRELLNYHQLFDKYNTYDGMVNIATINALAGNGPVQVNCELFEFLEFCKNSEVSSDGLVNVGMGSVLNIWHDYREGVRVNEDGPNLPPMEELMLANDHTAIDNLILNNKDQTVSFKDKDFQLDVGAIGKGYSVEKVASQLRENNQIHMLLNVGGNVCAIGAKPDGTDWNIGIQNPDTTSEKTYIAKVSVSNESVVTSGDYQRFYEVEGIKYCHIIDPSTLMPATNCHSVTVVTKNSAQADLWSTMLFNMTIEEGQNYVEATKGLEAMWVDLNNNLIYSRGFGGDNEEE